MKKLPVLVLLILAAAGILLAAAAVYLLSFDTVQEPALTAADIRVQQQRIDALNQKKDIPSNWQEGYAQPVGTYQGHEVVVEFLCFGGDSSCPQNGVYYLIYRDIDSPASCDALGGTPISISDPLPHTIGCGVAHGLVIPGETATTTP